MPYNVAQKPYLCPRCGRPLIKKIGPAGFFWGCSHYPRCKKTFSDDHGKPLIRKQFDYTCPNCRRGTLIRQKVYKLKQDGHPRKTYHWVCNAIPTCGAAFPDFRNKPKLSKQLPDI